MNVQKKGLGASKGILGVYNLCLTDKTLTLVKVRGGATETPATADGIEFTLKNIRRLAATVFPNIFYFLFI